MTLIYDFHLFHFFKIIYFNTFSEFFNYVYIIFKLNILSNHAKYLKRLAPYYTLSFFRNILKNVKLKKRNKD